MDPRQTKIYLAIVIASVIIGIIIVYFIISLIRHQRKYIAATKRNILAEIAILEKDRMRIAADLHDELAPILTAVKFQVDSIDPTDPSEQEVLTTTKQQIDHIALRLREISKDLMPASLTRSGLIPALQEFFNLISKAHSLRIAFSHHTAAELSEENRINLYRIIQEITHNTIKHARASTLLVRIEEKINVWQVLCEDNGIGFDYHTVIAKESGLGLRNIKSRATVISNNFNVVSQVGKGTQYIFDIPLN